MQPRSPRNGGPRSGSAAGPGGAPGPGLSAAALAGAVDLSALRSRPAPPPAAASADGDGAAGGAASSGAVSVVDVTEETFTAEVVERSRTVPVVIDFWAEWCGPCKQLSPVLERLAAEGGGSWVLAKIDVDSNQRLAAAAGVQGIPAVKAVVDGQIVGEFTGALPEAQVRQWIDALLDAVGAARGQAGGPDGTGGPDGAGGLAEPPEHLLAAEDALQRGDVAAAEAAFQTWLDESPADPIARRGLAHVRLLGRLQGRAEPEIRAAAEAAPDDVDAQAAAADLELASGAVEAAFDRLVGLVRRTTGTDRDRAREHLIGLFDVLGADDPRVPAARRDLASALF